MARFDKSASERCSLAYGRERAGWRGVSRGGLIAPLLGEAASKEEHPARRADVATPHQNEAALSGTERSSRQIMNGFASGATSPDEWT